jgi:tetratricopeptide (TPR) repeat protein
MEAVTDIKACNTCGVKIADFSHLTCGGCMNRVYCCKDHQRKDWGLHKHGCKYNPDGCAVCGEREGLQSCAGCLHRKYCCAEHQKEAWKDHKPLCNVYKELKITSNTDPDETASALLDYNNELIVEKRFELALPVIVEALAMTKHFGLKELHFICLKQIGGTLSLLKKFEEAEIFARDAIEFARDELPDTEWEIDAAGTLATVLLSASKDPEAIELCDSYLELYGAEDTERMNGLKSYRSQALSGLDRHEEALAQLAFVRTSNCACMHDWETLSDAQHNVGQLIEAIKSMEKAVGLARVGDPRLSPAYRAQGLLRMCQSLAELYDLGGRPQDARRLMCEVETLS